MSPRHSLCLSNRSPLPRREAVASVDRGFSSEGLLPRLLVPVFRPNNPRNVYGGALQLSRVNSEVVVALHRACLSLRKCVQHRPVAVRLYLRTHRPTPVCSLKHVLGDSHLFSNLPQATGPAMLPRFLSIECFFLASPRKYLLRNFHCLLVAPSRCAPLPPGRASGMCVSWSSSCCCEAPPPPRSLPLFTSRMLCVPRPSPLRGLTKLGTPIHFLKLPLAPPH